MKIEAIFRQSTMDDIRQYWEATGRHFNAIEDGQMVFEDVNRYETKGEFIFINTEKGDFIYRMSDFYRWKIT